MIFAFASRVSLFLVSFIFNTYSEGSHPNLWVILTLILDLGWVQCPRSLVKERETAEEKPNLTCLTAFKWFKDSYFIPNVPLLIPLKFQCFFTKAHFPHNFCPNKPWAQMTSKSRLKNPLVSIISIIWT